MSVWDTTRNAPGMVRMQKDQQFNITASTGLEINRISYTFSQWSGASTSTNASLTSQSASEHKNYTANFTSKPLWPDNISAGGTIGDYPHLTWTEHPNSYVTQYQIWRRVKENGVLQSPTQLTTVNRGTTSYIDYDYLITSGYTDDICYYDVRPVFVVQGQATQYSDPYWSGGIFTTNNDNIVPAGDSKLNLLEQVDQPKDFGVSSYPNPFNPSTTLRYELPKDGRVVLDIYDVMGRKVRNLVDGSKSAGNYTVVWNGRDETGKEVASGMYLYRFVASPANGENPFKHSGKMLLTR